MGILRTLLGMAESAGSFIVNPGGAAAAEKILQGAIEELRTIAHPNTVFYKACTALLNVLEEAEKVTSVVSSGAGGEVLKVGEGLIEGAAAAQQDVQNAARSITGAAGKGLNLVEGLVGDVKKLF